ncbi:MAG: tetratricopeptide repeat protein [Chloracidobacterium sp.]|nr:tetratricopeptide repeat protein [Chloracidobacterium sp.]
MNKDKILFGVAGLIAGLVVGFYFANSINQQTVTTAAQMPSAQLASANSNIPPGHPDISGAGGDMTGQGEIQTAVLAAVDKAKLAPNDADAQLKVAVLYYQLNRFDEAITYLKKAYELKPNDLDVLMYLGNANFDGEHYEEAEKWYMAALAKKSDDPNVRTDLGLTFVFRSPPNFDRAIQEFNRSLEADPNHIQTLQNLTVAYNKKGDTAKARATLARLESVDPGNSAIKQLRSEIDSPVTK